MPERAVAVWLLVCCAMIFAMIIVGGATRLTHSGLSIVEWQPLVGTLPPLNQSDWEATFAKYQETPEYKKINRGMSLEAFKRIFWWEYFHRLLGRVIGVVFLLPFLYFALKKKIRHDLTLKFAAVFVLGALQGGLGWYMVKSGLVDNPRVSHYRLTAHLGLAVLLYSLLLWMALGLLRPRPGPNAELPRLRGYAAILTALIFVMILSGGLVAGMRAGHAYNTFPLMAGRLIPADLFALEPWYRNFFTNMVTVQFDHRLIAWLLAFAVPAFWFYCRRHALSKGARTALNLLMLALIAQIALGISTLLLIVPVGLAVAHQAGAVALISASLLVAHELS
jgi:cytochrome c oxidase assembly protein subunit 15